MQAQMMPSTTGTPKISKEKCKEIFIKSEEKKMASMKNLMSNAKMNQADPMEGMIDMMIEQAKLSDEMYEDHGVDEEEFNSAMVVYNLMQDKEVQGIIMANMQKLGLGGAGGGFGGMM